MAYFFGMFDPQVLFAVSFFPSAFSHKLHGMHLFNVPIYGVMGMLHYMKRFDDKCFDLFGFCMLFVATVGSFCYMHGVIDVF